jgi:hypothetical protein
VGPGFLDLFKQPPASGTAGATLLACLGSVEQEAVAAAGRRAHGAVRLGQALTLPRSATCGTTEFSLQRVLGGGAHGLVFDGIVCGTNERCAVKEMPMNPERPCGAAEAAALAEVGRAAPENYLVHALPKLRDAGFDAHVSKTGRGVFRLAMSVVKGATVESEIASGRIFESLGSESADAFVGTWLFETYRALEVTGRLHRDVNLANGMVASHERVEFACPAGEPPGEEAFAAATALLEASGAARAGVQEALGTLRCWADFTPAEESDAPQALRRAAEGRGWPADARLRACGTLLDWAESEPRGVWHAFRDGTSMPEYAFRQPWGRATEWSSGAFRHAMSLARAGAAGVPQLPAPHLAEPDRFPLAQVALQLWLASTRRSQRVRRGRRCRGPRELDAGESAVFSSKA